MLAKHFKDLLKNIPDNTIILFDDGSGTYYPLKSMFQLKVTTHNEPGDPDPEFINFEEALEEFNIEENLEDSIDSSGLYLPVIDALIFSVDENIVPG